MLLTKRSVRFAYSGSRDGRHVARKFNSSWLCGNKNPKFGYTTNGGEILGNGFRAVGGLRRIIIDKLMFSCFGKVHSKGDRQLGVLPLVRD